MGVYLSRRSVVSFLYHHYNVNVIDSFKNKLKQGYWTQGSTWEFDWYIDVFFAEVMAYGSYPVKLGYEQAILGDQFLNPTNENEVISSFSDFFQEKEKGEILLNDQNEILNSADKLIKQLRNGQFDIKNYEAVQKNLSLLMASVSVVFDDLIAKELQKIAFKEKIGEQELIAYLVDSSSHTMLNKSNESLLKIYKQYKKEFIREKFKLSELSKEARKAVQNHTTEYGWLNTGERGGKPWTEKDLLRQLSVLVSKTKSEKESHHPFGLSPRNTNLLHSFIEININDNVAADKQIKLDYLFQKYLKENLKKSYVEEIFENLTYKEILEVLENPQNINKFTDRKNNQSRACWQENNKVNLHYFDKKEEFEKVRLLIKKNKTSDKIRGTIACQGIVKGYARIIRSRNDLLDFKEGEVMVAEKTQPSYVPYMVKATAIITNVGGITSHAAIISREFEIPSIVGTKDATETLKTGDYLLVDAEEGTVAVIR